jgi:hypothetical protein
LIAAAQAAGPRASSSNSIAASPPAAPAAAAARAAPVPIARAVAAPAPTVAAVEEDDADGGDADDRKADALRRVASAALRHLAPMSKAQAAPAVHVKAANEDWGVQLGAFRDHSAARQALRRIAGVSAAAGKPQQVLAPAKSDRRGLYRARLLRFNESDARAACAALKRRKIECTVVRSGVRLARG